MNEASSDSARQQRLEVLLGEALSMDADLVPQWLDTVCADEPDVRAEFEARWVAESTEAIKNRPAASRDELGTTGSWIPPSARPAGQRVIDRWLAVDADRVAADRVASDPQSDDLVGRQVGPYTLGRPIGRGSMGVVYQARDDRLDRTVAIKMLPAGRHDEADKARFAREARAASAIDHPNICTVHDVGEIPEGPLFLVMSYYEGETLADRLKRGPLPVEEALDLAIQVARGLGRAHEAGVIHRDIKPANIMVTDDGIAKILDFGIARVAGGLGLTQSGVAVGTPTYMSPEQALGEPVDARADLWALGVVLYEMLTGRQPFSGENAVELARAIVDTEPAPVRRLRDEVPDAIAVVIRRALAKSVDARYPNARTLLADLGEDEGSSPTGSVIQLGARSSRPSAWVLVAVALLFCAVGAMMWWAGSHSGPVEPKTARDFERLGAEALVTYWRPGQVEHAIESYQRAVTLGPDRASAYAGLGRGLWRRYRAEGDGVWLDQASANLQRAIELDEHLTETHATLGLVRLAQGDLTSARRSFQWVLRRDPNNADAHRGLGRVWQIEGDLERAEAALEKAVSLQPTLELFGMIGGLYFRLGQYTQAEAAFVRARDLDPEEPSGYKNVAAALHMQGRSAEAARQLQQALVIQPDSTVYNNLGTLYYFQGLYVEAVSAFKRAIELGANDYRNWANLGDAYRQLPDHADLAIDAFRTAWVGLEPKLREPKVGGEVLALAAEYQAKAGDLRASSASLAVFDRLKGVDGASLFNVTQAATVADELDRALAYLERALESGFALEEVRNEPDLAPLRKDPRYHRLVASIHAERAPRVSDP